MSARLRLLPIVIFSAALFLTVRVGGIYVEVGGTSVAETAPGKPIDLTTGMSAAGRNSGDKAKGEAARTEPAKDDSGKAGMAKGQPAKAEATKAEATKTDGAKPGATATGPAKAAADPASERAMPDKPAVVTPAPERTAEGAATKPATTGKPDAAKPVGEAAPGKTADPVAVDATPARPILPRMPPKDEALPDPEDMSRADLKILQELAQRRREMERREQDLQMREGLLKAAEKRVEEKITELAATKAKLEGLVKQHQEQQSVQLKSLVKIYESMKPKDAAQIFEELDMTILVELLAHMKEAKSAPIMAAMDPKRVKDVTARLINRRTLGPTAENKGEKTTVR
jgi:flagellar motility protein MotE (MotC chaperone)